MLKILIIPLLLIISNISLFLRLLMNKNQYKETKPVIAVHIVSSVIAVVAGVLIIMIL